MAKIAVLDRASGNSAAKVGKGTTAVKTKAKRPNVESRPIGVSSRALNGSSESDIDKILKEAAMRVTDEYKLGQKEALDVIYEQFDKDYKEDLGKYAEAFYCEILKQRIPKEDVIQHRIGLDPASGIPTVLSIISEKYERKLAELYEISYLLSYRLFETEDYECQFWVITDHSLDQNSIDHDFPYCREEN